MGKDAASAGPWKPVGGGGELGLHPEEEKRLLNMHRHSTARLAFQRENSGSSLHSSQCSQFPDEETEDLSRAVPCLRSSGWTVSTPGFHPGLLSPHPATVLKAVTALPTYSTKAAEALTDEFAQTSSAALRPGARAPASSSCARQRIHAEPGEPMHIK